MTPNTQPTTTSTRLRDRARQVDIATKIALSMLVVAVLGLLYLHLGPESTISSGKAWYGITSWIIVLVGFACLAIIVTGMVRFSRLVARADQLDEDTDELDSDALEALLGD